MKVLLIGGRGFLGGYLADALAPNHEVYITSRDRSRSLIRNADGDRPLGLNTNEVLKFKYFTTLPEMDVVFPLAARLGHAECMKDPVGSLFVSPRIVLRLLVVLRNSTRKSLIAYPSSHTAHKPLTSPYSVHKVLAEMYLEMFSKTYGFDTIVFRLGTLYGPGQKRPSIVNFYVKRGLKGQTLPIYKGREYDRLALCYVEDAAWAFSEVIDHRHTRWPPPDVVSSCCTLLEIAETVSKVVGGQVELGVECSPIFELVNPGDSPVASSFVRLTSLEIGVQKTMEWMKNDTE